MTAASGIMDEESREKSTRLVGYSLLIGFFFPIWMKGFGVNRPVFVNIEGLGKGDFLMTIDLLLPLIAGIVVLWAGLKLEERVRAVAILGVGLVWVILGLINTNALLNNNIGKYNTNSSFFLIFILALIGVYVGSRLVANTDHIAGRLLGGISGILFMALALLPIGKGSKPVFFSLFDLFKAGKISGAFTVLGIALVGIFLCYLYASLIAALNLGVRPSSEQTATNAYKLVYYASIALPVSILVILMFSGAGFMVLITSIIKVTLWMGGFIGAISLGLLDLLDQFMPKTLKGAALLENSQPGDQPPVDQQPPNIWNG